MYFISISIFLHFYDLWFLWFKTLIPFIQKSSNMFDILSQFYNKFDLSRIF